MSFLVTSSGDVAELHQLNQLNKFCLLQACARTYGGGQMP